MRAPSVNPRSISRRRLKPWQASSRPTTSAGVLVRQIRQAHDVGRATSASGAGARNTLAATAGASRNSFSPSVSTMRSRRRLDDPHDLADAKAVGDDLRERDLRLVLEVHDAAHRVGGPGRHRRAGWRARRRLRASESDRRADRASDGQATPTADRRPRERASAPCARPPRGPRAAAAAPRRRSSARAADARARPAAPDARRPGVSSKSWPSSREEPLRLHPADEGDHRRDLTAAVRRQRGQRRIGGRGTPARTGASARLRSVAACAGCAARAASAPAGDQCDQSEKPRRTARTTSTF